MNVKSMIIYVIMAIAPIHLEVLCALVMMDIDWIVQMYSVLVSFYHLCFIFRCANRVQFNLYRYYLINNDLII